MYIPVPRKTSLQYDSNHDFSKVVKVTSPRTMEQNEMLLEKPEPKQATNIEEEQQQKILQLFMQNTMMLNNTMIQHETSKRLVLRCMEAVANFR